HRERVQEVEDAVGANHDHAVRLGAGRRQLRDELRRADADARDQTEFAPNVRPDPLRDARGVAAAHGGACQVDERLVQRVGHDDGGVESGEIDVQDRLPWLPWLPWLAWRFHAWRPPIVKRLYFLGRSAGLSFPGIILRS